jgi:hypothetical protein
VADAAIVAPGHHVLVAKKPLFDDARREFDAAASDQIRLDVHLIRHAAAPPTKQMETTPPAAPPRRHVSPLVPVGWAVTAGLLGGAVATFVVSRGAAANLDEMKGQQSSQASREHEASKTNTFGGVALGLGVGAVAAAGASLWLTLRSPSPRSSARAQPSWSILLGPGQLGARGSF